MKKVKLNNKLQLNKETIAKLNNEEMNHLAGGQVGTILSLCKSCIGSHCGCPPPTQTPPMSTCAPTNCTL